MASSEPAPEGDTVTLSKTGANITVSGTTFSGGQTVNAFGEIASKFKKNK